jgi:hypothetical protein
MKENHMFDLTCEKILLVEQAEETITSYLEKLDSDLKKFEHELGPDEVAEIYEEEKREARMERDKERMEVAAGGPNPNRINNSVSLIDLKNRKGGRISSSNFQDDFASGITSMLPAPSLNRQFSLTGNKSNSQLYQDLDDRFPNSSGARLDRVDASGTAYVERMQPRLPKQGEDVFCYCQMITDGEMIACDNKRCKIEWFHLECVNLKKAPKGAWYCDACKPLYGM